MRAKQRIYLSKAHACKFSVGNMSPQHTSKQFSSQDFSQHVSNIDSPTLAQQHFFATVFPTPPPQHFSQHFSTTLCRSTLPSTSPQHFSQHFCARLFLLTPFRNTFPIKSPQHFSTTLFPTLLHNTFANAAPPHASQDSSQDSSEHFFTINASPNTFSLHTSQHLPQDHSTPPFPTLTLPHNTVHSTNTSAEQSSQHFSTTLFHNTSPQRFSTTLFARVLHDTKSSPRHSPQHFCKPLYQHFST